MMGTTHAFYDAYKEARTRLALVIQELSPEDLSKKLLPGENSIGFLLRHIGDVELLFAKNVFRLEGVEVKAQTVIDKLDTGIWTNLEDLQG